MLEKTGVPEPEQIKKITPSEERLQKGPVAVVECFQNIPCDPCLYACRQGAIKEFEDINDLPVIDHELCNGCGLCISECPGLAIFVIDATYGEEEGLIKLPYEYLPLPGQEEEVTGIDTEGRAVCSARVIKVQNTKALDRTPVVTLAVPRQHLMRVRSFVRKGGE